MGRTTQRRMLESSSSSGPAIFTESRLPPGVAGFLSPRAANAPLGFRLRASSRLSAWLARGPTPASALAHCPQPGLRAAHFRRGSSAPRRGALRWRQRGVLPGGKVENEGRRRLLGGWVEQRSSSLEAPRHCGLVAGPRPSSAFPSGSAPRTAASSSVLSWDNPPRYLPASLKWQNEKGFYPQLLSERPGPDSRPNPPVFQASLERSLVMGLCPEVRRP